MRCHCSGQRWRAVAQDGCDGGKLSESVQSHRTRRAVCLGEEGGGVEEDWGRECGRVADGTMV